MHVEPKIHVSKAANNESKNALKIAVVESIQQPSIPMKRPKKTQDIKLIKGKIRIQEYIRDLLLKEKIIVINKN